MKETASLPNAALLLSLAVLQACTGLKPDEESGVVDAGTACSREGEFRCVGDPPLGVLCDDGGWSPVGSCEMAKPCVDGGGPGDRCGVPTADAGPGAGDAAEDAHRDASTEETAAEGAPPMPSGDAMPPQKEGGQGPVQDGGQNAAPDGSDGSAVDAGPDGSAQVAVDAGPDGSAQVAVDAGPAAIPETLIVSGPASVERVDAVVFSFSSDVAAAYFECSLDGSAFASCSSPVSYGSLEEGAHIFRVRAATAEDRYDASTAEVMWSVDTVAPDVQIEAPSEGASTGAYVALTFSVDDPAASTDCAFDGGPYEGCVSGVARYFAQGSHEVAVRATDPAGNVSTRQRAWTVTCSAPGALPGAFLHLDFEDAPSAQTLANSANDSLPAVRGETTAVETNDPSAAAGRYGQGMTFQRSEMDVVHWDTPAPMTPATFTVEAWFRSMQTPSDGPAYIWRAADGSAHLRFTDLGDGTIGLSTYLTGGGAHSEAVAPLAWHHTVVTYDGSELQLYVDGEPARVVASPSDVEPLLGSLFVGNGNYFEAGGIDGVIDAFSASEVVLTAEEVRARYCPF